MTQAKYRIINMTRETVLASSATKAESFMQRVKGLLGRTHFSPDDAMIFERCQCVHMLGMRFAIDVLFVDVKGMTLQTVSHLKPWQMSPWVWQSQMVIELPSGILDKTQTVIGDQLRIEKV